jgi:Tol biopolymer transport system component/DNA-binding winged helix-turn-helix (wHTH) protein
MTFNDSHRARFGPFEVDLHTHELWKFGTRMKLVGQPFEILAVLLSRPGELVTREELRQRLWPSDTFVDFNHGLNAAVNKLRAALGDLAEAPRYVETLPRRGYRFVAAIEWVDAKAEHANPAVAIVNLPPMPPAEISAKPPGAPEPAAQTEAQTQVSHPLPWQRYLTGTTPLKTSQAIWFGLRWTLGGGVGLLALLFVCILLIRTVSGSGANLASRPPVEHTRPLTTIAGTLEPAFSPDGNSVAFTRDGVKGIFVTAIGSDQFLQLTSDDDCCPVWSPDGRSIAFSRFANKEISIYVVLADAGSEQKQNAERTIKTTAAAFSLTAAPTGEHRLNTSGAVPQHREIDWSPDGKSIAFAARAGIYLLALDTSTVHRISQPLPMAEDWGPSFSADGQKVLFVRNREIGRPDEIWATTTAGVESRVLSEPGKIASPPQWSSDGRSVIFASSRSGHPALWRAAFDAPDSIVQIGEAGSPAWDPAVSHRGYRFAYERITRSLSVWQMDLATPEKQPHLLVSSTSDTDQGPGPQFSPDGQKLAYMSDHSGTMEIWVSNRDGSRPFQLTAVGGAGTPRWSPDSQSIVFDVNRQEGGSKVVRINLRGGAPQILTPGDSESLVPSWSRDGKWIYFASSRSGDVQVWKVPATGGSPVQVTRNGGHAALESPDGKFVYYAKSSAPEPEIWQVPVDGGTETPLPLVRPGTWASWQVVDTGILFVGPSLGHRAVLSFFDFGHRRTTTIAVLDRVPFWLGATPDGRTVAFDQPGQEQGQTMLVDNFR